MGKCYALITELKILDGLIPIGFVKIVSQKKIKGAVGMPIFINVKPVKNLCPQRVLGVAFFILTKGQRIATFLKFLLWGFSVFLVGKSIMPSIKDGRNGKRTNGRFTF